MNRLDEIEKIITALKWLKARRRDAHYKSEGLRLSLWYHSSKDPEFDRHRYREALSQVEVFDTLIAQHGARLSEYRRKIRQQRQTRAADAVDPEALIYAVPRLDVFSVKGAEAISTFADASLATQIAQRATALESWNYRCLGRRERTSRRYEGFQRN